MRREHTSRPAIRGERLNRFGFHRVFGCSRYNKDDQRCWEINDMLVHMESSGYWVAVRGYVRERK